MKNLAAGFRALSHVKLVLLLTVTTVLLGLAVAAPLGPALSASVGGTLAGDHFLRNAPTLAPSDFFDFVREEKGAVAGARGASRLAGLFSVILQMFFAGGIVAVLGRGAFSFGQFLEPARRNFWHNVKCVFLFALMLAVVYGIVFGGAFAASKKIFEGVPPDADSRTTWDWGLRILAVLIWGVCSLLYDFARAARRYSPLIGAWRAFRFGRRALSGSWTKGLALFLFWFLLGGALWLACIAAAWYLPAVSVPSIALLFVLQLLGLGARSAVRIATWGSYLAFLDSRARAAIAATTRIKYTIAVGDRDPVVVS